MEIHSIILKASKILLTPYFFSAGRQVWFRLSPISLSARPSKLADACCGRRILITRLPLSRPIQPFAFGRTSLSVIVCPRPVQRFVESLRHYLLVVFCHSGKVYAALQPVFLIILYKSGLIMGLPLRAALKFIESVTLPARIVFNFTKFSKFFKPFCKLNMICSTLRTTLFFCYFPCVSYRFI